MHFLEGVAKFLVEARQGIEERHREILEPDADFVGDARLAQADFVGLPELGDFRLNDRLTLEGFGVGPHDEIESEVDYCLLCQERDKDSCSKGFKEKTGAFKPNPLGVNTTL